MKDRFKKQAADEKSTEKVEKRKYYRDCCDEYKTPTECCDHTILNNGLP